MNRFANRNLQLEILEDRRLLSVQPFAAPPDSNDQIITPSEVAFTVAPGDPVIFDVNYSTDPAETDLSGIGVRMFYDSSMLTSLETTNVFEDTPPNMTIKGNQIQDDVDNLDGDDSTDKFLLTAWASGTGGDYWPWFADKQPDIPLYTANFTTASDAIGSTTINYNASSVAASGGGWTFVSTPVEITFNQPPVADAGGPYAVNEGGSVPLDASNSTDPDQVDSTLTYEWDLDGDSLFGETGAAAGSGDELGIAPSFSAVGLDGPSSVDVTLRVTDDSGVSSEDTATINVANIAPTVSAGSDANATVGIAFAGIGTFSDPGADSWTASVDYGDGTGSNPLTLSGNSFSLNHVYLAAGTYSVTVTVNDGTADGTDTLDVIVVAPPNTVPVVSAGSNATVDVGAAFTDSGSFTDPDADSWTASVDYGDGTGSNPLTLSGKAFDLSHTYTVAGTYTVTVTVNDGTADGNDTLDVTVVAAANTVPVVSAGSDATVDVGVAFTGSGTFTDPDADSWTASVDYGDGTGNNPLTLSGNAFNLNHTYTTAGNYITTVTVNDGTADGTDTVLVTVSAIVTNTAPVVSAGSNATVDVGAAFTGSGTFTDPDADSWTASVDYGDGTGDNPLTLSGNAFNLNHTYATAGTYTVTVTVNDGTADGNDTLDVTVMAAANTIPVVSAGSNATVDVDAAFTGSGTFTDPDADSWTASVDYGDGAGDNPLTLSGNAFDLNHTYTAAGTYLVTVTVNDGTASGTDTVSVTVTTPSGLYHKIITSTPSSQTVTSGDPVSFDVVYSTDPASTDTTGVGIMMFYDSSVLTSLEATDLFGSVPPGVTLQGNQIQDDTDNLDEDAATDKFFLTGWATSGSNWPGFAGSTDITLYSANFTTAADATGSTTIRYMDSSDASQWTLVSTPVVINFNSGTSGSPTAEAGGPYTVPEGGIVAMNSSGTTDPDQHKSTLLYEWDFDGDSNFGETGTAAEQGDEVGIYPVFSSAGITGPTSTTVTLRVTDDTGLFSFDTAVINVTDATGGTNAAPVVDAGLDATATVNTQFTSTGSFTDSDSSSWTASVNYGDGTGNNSLALSGNSFTLDHTYDAVGTYSVTVVVNDGTYSGADTLVVTVGTADTNTPPDVNVGIDATTYVNTLFTGTGSFTDSDSSSWTALVNYGDGTGDIPLALSGNSFSLNHTYTTVGTYPVTVTVNDGTDSGTDSLTVTVQDLVSTNTVPIVSAGSDAAATVGTAFTGTGSFFDPDSNTWNASVDYGDGTGIVPLTLTGNSFTLDHTYTTAGIYPVTVTVNDGLDSDADTLLVSVTLAGANTPPIVIAGDDATSTIGALFSGTGSFTDPDADSWTASVNYGDGTGDSPLALSGKTFGLSHVYSANGLYTVTVTVNDGTNSSTDSFDVTVNNNLGTIDFLELPNQDPSTADLMYQLSTTRAGFLTLEALNSTATLTLLDSAMTPVATSTLVNGISRIDYQATAGGETFYLELSDSSSDVDLRLTNLVNHVGTAVTVEGTENVDSFTFLPDTSYHVTINGVAYDFDPATVGTVDFNGDLGDDTADVTGTSGQDFFTTNPGTLTMESLGVESPGLLLTVLDVPVIVIRSSGGDQDKATLYDCDGDDTATLDFDETHLSGTSLIGQYYSVDTYGVDTVQMLGNAGGHDTATMTGTTGYDELRGLNRHTVMRHNGLKIRTDLFEEVVAYSLGGNDLATLRDSAGDEHMAAWPDRVTYTGDGFLEDLHGFYTVTGFGRNGGYDTVEFHDSPENDIFRGFSKGRKSELFSVAADGTRNFSVAVREFEEIVVTATTGIDRARLFGSTGDDVFTGRLSQSSIIGPGVNVTVNGFDRVDATAMEGGNDTAYLYDTPGNDRLLAKDHWAKLFGSTSLLYKVNHFENVTADGQAGGSNSKDVDAIDYVLQLVDPSDWT